MIISGSRVIFKEGINPDRERESWSTLISASKWCLGVFIAALRNLLIKGYSYCSDLVRTEWNEHVVLVTLSFWIYLQ